VLKTWPFALLREDDPYSLALRVQELLPLITNKTRIIAFTACSNILGSILPVKNIVAAIRQKAKQVGAMNLEICLDCVAYAPHMRMDVKGWDVDYAVFSFYKVCLFLHLIGSINAY
jgi:selenocysteine lyase/cysteine desulfurase